MHHFGEIGKDLGIECLRAKCCGVDLVFGQHAGIPILIFVGIDGTAEVDIAISAIANPVYDAPMSQIGFEKSGQVQLSLQFLADASVKDAKTLLNNHFLIKISITGTIFCG